MSQPEQPWQPGPDDLPFTTHLTNPHSDRHPGFNDVDQIIKLSVIWTKTHPADPRSDALADEVAAGTKAVVLHVAQTAQAPVQRGSMSRPPLPNRSGSRPGRGAVLPHRRSAARAGPHDGDVVLLDPGSVVTTRYRPRGTAIPSPWPDATS
ncbi:hypothetical protein [Streptomyces morookaense]|uniref:Uncharacterized protein n=1 Tax=Streptomyces morookaense TaxID=1970 RepID=A0A7Y7B7E8_STRMO|nr:hypothetical protein [Streptomyces morookaense]NVK80290.1 hypothetical protein [Streptomyces morookaense]